MTGYRVDPAQLSEAERTVRGVAAQARAELAALRGAEAALLSGGWQSPAGTAFRHGWAEWAAAVDAMLEALELLGAAVGLAGRDYTMTDSSVRSYVQSTAHGALARPVPAAKT